MKTLLQLFEYQADKHLTKTALVCSGISLSYEALNTRANQLAHYLKNLGIGPELVVAIGLPRCPETVIAILAILKTGAAFLPLDLSNPAERLQFMLADAGVCVLITDTTHEQDFAGYSGQYFLVDQDWETQIHAQPTENLEFEIQSSSLAYVIYTSGSTGQPKGVLIEHGSLLNYLQWCLTIYPCELGTGTIIHSSFAFDMVMTSLFVPLIVGKTIHLMSEQLGAEALLKALEDDTCYSFIKLTPSHLNLLRGQLTADELNRKTHALILGGEKLLKSEIDHWQHPASTLKIFNEYGPTESTVACSVYEVGSSDFENDNIPIGKAMKGSNLLLLDKYQKKVPSGIPGEIYIGGICLARGYLNRQALTEERFISNPYVPGERLYRSGDRGRYLADGNIEYLGRIDDQVKLRGYRIELGEVGSVASAHPSVKEAVAILREDVPGHKRLICYVVLQSEVEAASAPETIQSYLEEKLPNYMVPTIVILKQMPLTSNGKIDRKGLPAPEEGGCAETYAAPRTEIEETLSQIWSNLLQLERVGIHDNFFQIGGDSIISIQLVAKARQAGLQLEISDVFEYPTIAQLANVTSYLPAETPVLSESSHDDGKELPLTPIQHWFFEQQLANLHHYNQSLLLEVNEVIDSNALKNALSAIVEIQVNLQVRFKRQADGYVGYVAKEVASEEILQVVNVKDLSPSEQSQTMEAICTAVQGSLHIEEGPLQKLVLFELGSGRKQRLCWVIHHLLVDGVSWRILLEDLESAYRQVANGQKIQLAPVGTSFGTWSRKLVGYSQSETIERESDYWKEVVRQSDVRLPQDLPGGVNNLETSAALRFTLDEVQTKRLLQAVPVAYRTQINDVLLTALVLAMGDWQGRGELNLLLEGHGREIFAEDIDISRTVGWFTSVFPLHLKITDRRDLGRSLKEVKEQLRGIPQKGMSYGVWRYLGGGKEEVIEEPLISFNYLGQWDSVAQARLLTFCSDSVGANIAGENSRRQLLEINCEVVRSCLEIEWRYSQGHYYETTISRLGENYLRQLNELIAHCCGESYGYTPSDFPLAQLDQSRIDEVFGKLEGVEDIYPLAPMQSGLLFHKLYTPTSDVYFIQTVFELTGEVLPAILKKSWELLSDHYSILRTGFKWEKLREPLQYVVKEVAIPWSEYDWQEKSENEIAHSLNDWLISDRQKGFDLEQAPLFRLCLIRLRSNHWYLVWSFHHLLLDGWCTPLLLEAMVNTYHQFKAGKEAVLPVFARPYRDYIQWLLKQESNVAEQFWKAYFIDFITPTYLSYHSALEKKQGKPGNSYQLHTVYLSMPETEQLQTYARNNQLTVNTVLQGAWSILLSRYVSQEDIVFGVTLSGRSISLPGVDKMVGLFINTLPLKVCCREDESVLTFLQQLQQQMSLLYQYTYLPLAKIQAWAGFERKEAGLFDTLFLFENYPDSDINEQVTDIDIKNIGGIEKTEYPLTLAIMLNDTLGFRFDYDDYHFKEAQIKAIARQFQQILKALIDPTTKKLAEISLLTTWEKKFLLHDSLSPSVAIEPKCLPALFEECVTQNAHHLALANEHCQLSYESINRRINQLAHYFISLGITRETIVAISLENPLEMLLVMLAVLKSGGAFLPIDANYPAEHIGYLLSDSQTQFAVSEIRLEEKLKDFVGKMILLDEISHFLETFPVDNPLVTINSNDLAYVIYTSGSTGRPKGVCLEHQSLSHLAQVQGQQFGIGPHSRVLQFASMSFDASVSEWSTTLIHGGTIYFLKRAEQGLVEPLAMTLEKYRITLVTLPPSILHSIQDAELTCLTTIVVAGEATSEALLAHWRKRVRLINAYGPTESTVCASMHEVDEQHPSGTIGRAMGNVRLYVLDQFLAPTPIGIPGEIYIGGVGLARCYLNRPELTRERFIANPYVANERLYQTGDRGRYLPNGNIEYLGRTDEQVKLRGYRIELAEVSLAANNHPQVKEAVVILREDMPGQKRLVCYVVLCEESENEKIGQDIVSYLEERLPAYMVPSLVVVLKQMPLTSNGKVDRKRLPAPEDKDHMDDYVAPRSEIEKCLAEMWAELLQAERVGIEDNFFQIGGDSIISIQLIAKARQKGLELEIGDVFDFPTIAQLARQINKASKPVACTVVKHAPESLMPLSYAQQRMWWLQKFFPSSGFYNISFAAKLNGLLNHEALRFAFNSLLNRHKILQTIIIESDGQPYQKISGSCDFQCEEINCEAMDSVQREELLTALMDRVAKYTFNLAQGPVIKGYLLHYSTDEHVLIIVQHHIVADGWSTEIFARDLAEFYNSFIAQKENILPTLPFQYADFAAWQREYLQGEMLTKQLSYWEKNLQGPIPTLALPIDKIRPKEANFEGATYWCQTNETTLQSLKELAGEFDCTLFMLLLSAFQVLLYRYSGQNDIIVGFPIANRHYPGVENLIGFFINTLAVRTYVDGAMSFTQLVKNVRQSTLEAYEHQDIPFEMLVEHLQLTREINRHPIFQAMFVLQNVGSSELNLTDIHVEFLAQQNQFAKFDLTLFAHEVDGRLELGFEYPLALFDTGTITAFAEHYLVLLSEIILHHKKEIGALALLSASQKNQLLTAWNQTARDYPRKTITELWEAQVLLTPNAVALQHGTEAMSFQMLNSQANKLANYLRECGVTVNSFVALCLPRGFNQIIAILAILKAGGAYVPIDPNHPSERQKYIMDDTKAQILLTLSHYLEKLPIYQARMVCLDKEWSVIAEKSSENLAHHNTVSDVAYIIYTSGSTGLPKGVLGHHLGISNRIQWMWEYYPFSVQEVCLQKTSLNFVDAICEIFVPLLKGIKLIQLSEEKENLAMLSAVIQAQGVTRLILVPSLLSYLLETPGSTQALSQLKLLMVSGEKLTPYQMNLVFERLPQTKLLNLYGSTEVAADATFSELIPEKQEGVVPLIGRPIANTNVFILDDRQQLSPIGAIGEIYVSGLGVADGYLNSAIQTAKRFTTLSLDYKNSIRCFRTGDLGRYHPDGNIEYIGRIDNQIKIRGQRIELEEIESALNQHEAIHSCTVVLVLCQQNKESYLVAYIKTNNDIQEQKKNDFYTELRSFLRTKIPDYMSPSYFVVVDSFPVTATGKIDRLALKQLNFATLKPVRRVLSPRNMTELTLLQIWQSLLQEKDIGIHDNFFALGGHSLLLISLLNKVEIMFNKKLTLSDVYQNTTIADLAKFLDVHHVAHFNDPLFLIHSGNGSIPLVLIHPVAGFSFVYGALSLHLNDPIYGVNNPFFGKPEQQFSTIEAMAEYYLNTLVKHFPSGPYRLGGWSFGGTVALEMARKLTESGQIVEIVLLIDSYNFEGLPLPALLEERQSAITNFLIAEQIDPTSMQGRDFSLELENNWKLLTAYKPKSFRGRVALIKAQDHDELSLDIHDDLYNRWSEQLLPLLELYSVPGKHHELFEANYVLNLAHAMNTILNSKNRNHHLGHLERNLFLAIEAQNIFLLRKILAMKPNLAAKDEAGNTLYELAEKSQNMIIFDLIGHYLENGELIYE